jgi:anti-anti-sigma factor
MAEEVGMGRWHGKLFKTSALSLDPGATEDYKFLMSYVSDPSPTRSKVALRLCGEIDVSNAEDLRSALEAGIEEGGPILIDVRELTFMDSAGVHVLVQAAEAMDDRGCLVIHGERRPLSRLLDLLGVDDMVKNLHRLHRNQESMPSGGDPEGGTPGEPKPDHP